MGLPAAWAALKAASENGAVVSACADDAMAVPASATATNAALKNLRVKAIVNSSGNPRPEGISARRTNTRVPRRCYLADTFSKILPHHPRDEPGLAPRRLDVLFQKAMRGFS